MRKVLIEGDGMMVIDKSILRGYLEDNLYDARNFLLKEQYEFYKSENEGIVADAMTIKNKVVGLRLSPMTDYWFVDQTVLAEI